MFILQSFPSLRLFQACHFVYFKPVASSPIHLIYVVSNSVPLNFIDETVVFLEYLFHSAISTLLISSTNQYFTRNSNVYIAVISVISFI